jgi:hypothetical protein
MMRRNISGYPSLETPERAGIPHIVTDFAAKTKKRAGAEAPALKGYPWGGSP